jgi:hypothetical protein
MRAPAVLLAVWLLTALTSLPLAVSLQRTLTRHLDSGMAADAAANGVNYAWMQGFGDQATGLGATFKPTIIGFGATLDSLSGLLDNVSRPREVVAAIVMYATLWLFCAGGIITRYMCDERANSRGFLAASRQYFVRFLRLGVVMAIVYGVLFRYVHGWLFGRVYDRLVHDLTVERTAFLIRVALYAVFGLLLAACNIVFDYAKVRTVVDGRRSMIGAIGASARFIRRHAGAALALYVADFALFLGAVALYGVAAPSAGPGGWSIWVALAIGQGYVLLRLGVKLVFYASEVELFTSSLP